MPVEETENEIRVRVATPEDFRRIVQLFPQKTEGGNIPDNLKDHWPYNEEGIRGLGGPLKTSGDIKIQAYRFSKADKYDWTPGKAEDWVKDQGETPKAAEILLNALNPLKNIIKALDSFWDQFPKAEANEFDCECLNCGHEMTSEAHCQDLTCPKCGGVMRRIDRPGPGQESVKSLECEIPFDYNFEFEVIKSEAEIMPEEQIQLDENLPVIYVEGYASTNALDRHDDIVDQLSITFDDFMNNPIMLFQHNPDWPIGRVVKLEKDVEIGDGKRGLLCRAAIIGDTMKSMEVMDQIKSGILKGFSIHGRAKSRKKKCSSGHCHYVLMGLNLLEISVVSIPANQETLFEVAKSLLAQIEQSINNGQGASGSAAQSMEDKTMNETDKKEITELIVKTISATKQELPPDLQSQLEAALALTEKVEANAKAIAEIQEMLSAEEGGEEGEEGEEAQLNEGSTVEVEVDGVKKTLKLVDPAKLSVKKAQGSSSREVDELSVKKQLAQKAHAEMYPSLEKDKKGA